MTPSSFIIEGPLKSVFSNHEFFFYREFQGEPLKAEVDSGVLGYFRIIVA